MNMEPNIASKLLEFTPQNVKITKYTPLDVLCLKNHFETLLPNDETLLNPQTQFIWTKKVKEVKPVVQHIFQTYRTNKHLFGDQSGNMMESELLVWTRLHIMQIYIVNVSPTGILLSETEKKSISSLGEVVNGLEDDMRSVKSWKTIETFLKKVLQTNSNNGEELAELMSNIQSFERRCFAFFVEVTTEFCFGRENFNELSPNVLQLIMGYAFHTQRNQTKQFSPIEDFAVDPTPIIRSFILQQLLKSDNNIIEDYIRKCLQSNLALAGNNEDRWNICQLFVHCFEDHETTRASSLKSKGILHYNYIEKISNELGKVQEYFKSNNEHKEVTSEFLEHVALARFALSGASIILCKRYLEGYVNNNNRTETALRRLFAQLQDVIGAKRNTDGHLFVLQNIIRCFGNEKLIKIIDESQFDWLAVMLNEPQPIANSDCYLVHSNEYKECREQFIDLLKRNADNVDFNIFFSKLNGKTRFYYQCAVMRIFQTERELLQFRENVPEIQNAVAEIQVVNALIEDKNIQQLLFHFMQVLKCCGDQDMLQLYAAFMLAPHLLQKKYLPAMPSENHEVVVNTQFDDETGGQSHTCPQGHVYITTERGGNDQDFQCPQCGSGLFKIKYMLKALNAFIHRPFSSQHGHCLGPAGYQPQQTLYERNLTPLSTHLQRFLIHLAMLLGVKHGYQQAISNLTNPRVNKEDISAFLIEHIQFDLDKLETIFARSMDDTNLILHLFMKHLLKKDSTSTCLTSPTDRIDYNLKLSTKEERDQLEESFHETYIESFMGNIDLDAARVEVLNDTRIASIKELRKLHELDRETIPEFGPCDYMSCTPLWKYRQPVTVESFKMIAQDNNIANKEMLGDLLFFLKQESLLIFIKELPSLMSLQRMLFASFNFTINREAADGMTIEEALEKEKEKLKEIENVELKRKREDEFEKLRILIDKTFRLWKELSPLLKIYDRLKTDPKNHPDILRNSDSLAYLLPSQIGHGRCMLALIDFLAHQQNNFLKQCNKSGEMRQVSLMNIRDSDVISYNPERDLLPLVFAHSDYTLTIGKETTVEYNLLAIQKHLIENISIGRPQIIIQIEEFVYTDDAKHLKKHLKLNSSVKQTIIPYEEQLPMMSELTQIKDVSKALRTVEISIGFLVSMKADPNLFFRKYLMDILQMDPDEHIRSKKMREFLRLTHLMSAWIMLEVEKAKRRYVDNEEPFVDIKEIFKKPLGKDIENKLQNYCQGVNTRVLLYVLTEYIVTELPQNTKKDANCCVADMLEKYEETRIGENEKYGDPIPGEVTLSQIYYLWKLVAKNVREYKNGQE